MLCCAELRAVTIQELERAGLDAAYMLGVNPEMQAIADAMGADAKSELAVLRCAALPLGPPAAVRSARSRLLQAGCQLHAQPSAVPRMCAPSAMHRPATSLAPPAVVNKTTASAFSSQQFREALKGTGAQTLIVMGVETD